MGPFPPKVRNICISQTIHQSFQRRTVTAMSARPPSFASNFPTSTAEPSAYFKWPGITWDSTKAVREVLEENNRGYDIYESRRFAHNHFPHSVFSRYAFGAPPKLIHDCWNHDKTHLVSLDPAGPDRKDVDETKVPKRITREDWGNHLGNKGCYAPYLVFFHDEIARLGPQGVLEEYIFSPQANWEIFTDPSSKDQGPPNMFNRLLAGAIHPFIHIGFGLEFNDRVVLAEGLAEAAVHPDVIVNLVIPPSHIQPLFTTSSPRPSSSPSLLSIYTSLISSPILTPQPYDPKSMVNDQLKSSVNGPKAQELRAIVDRWSLSDEEVADGPNGWQKKFEEIAVFATLLACATGRKGKEIRVDFFLMHALTSSIFLPAYLSRLPPSFRRALLRRYILEAFHTALARGRPSIDPELIMSYDLYPTINTEGSEDALKKLVKEDKALGKGEKEERNAWLSLVESAMVYPDSHVIKSIRSLAHYASLLGNSPPGGLPGTYKEEGRGVDKEEAVKGMSKLDGSVFLRAAGAIMTTMAPGGEGAWDRSQLGYDEAWE